ncbi:MAG: bifunctional phosphoribosyl-AMP cyclohydrolase/phosphoribosyl-ATP diphosphatase HisIE, partial [Saprospiraceae bacterium]
MAYLSENNQPDFLKMPDGLIPAIVQDADTRQVLMLGYMNEAAWALTQKTGFVTFFSRSRQRLWTKGESSGNHLKVQEILLDCDQDTILIKASPLGPVCHTGSDTCWGEQNQANSFLAELEQIILQRKKEGSEKSYTSSLFAAGIPKMAQKVGEEAVETVIEALGHDRDLFLNET